MVFGVNPFFLGGLHIRFILKIKTFTTLSSSICMLLTRNKIARRNSCAKPNINRRVLVGQLDHDSLVFLLIFKHSNVMKINSVVIWSKIDWISKDLQFFNKIMRFHLNSYKNTRWRPPSLSKLTPIIFNMKFEVNSRKNEKKRSEKVLKKYS